jgi:hypothetical protein
VPLKNGANTFTGANTFNGASTFGANITANATGVTEHVFRQAGNDRFRVTAIGTKSNGVSEMQGIATTGILGTVAGTNNLTTAHSYVVLNPSLGSLNMVLPTTTAVIGQTYFMEVINRDITGTNTITFDAGSGKFVHTSVTYGQTYTMSGAKANQSHRWFRVVKIDANTWSVTSNVADM